jgi:hypothetical protein
MDVVAQIAADQRCVQKTVEREFKESTVSRVPENLRHDAQVEGKGVKLSCFSMGSVLRVTL